MYAHSLQQPPALPPRQKRAVYDGRLVFALDFDTPNVAGNKYFIRNLKLKGGPAEFVQVCPRCAARRLTSRVRPIRADTY